MGLPPDCPCLGCGIVEKKRTQSAVEFYNNRTIILCIKLWTFCELKNLKSKTITTPKHKKILNNRHHDYFICRVIIILTWDTHYFKIVEQYFARYVCPVALHSANHNCKYVLKSHNKWTIMGLIFNFCTSKYKRQIFYFGIWS